jgi:hypothetical protein
MKSFSGATRTVWATFAGATALGRALVRCRAGRILACPYPAIPRHTPPIRTPHPPSPPPTHTLASVRTSTPTCTSPTVFVCLAWLGLAWQAEYDALRASHDDLSTRLEESERRAAALCAERDAATAALADTTSQLKAALAALADAQLNAAVSAACAQADPPGAAAAAPIGDALSRKRPRRGGRDQLTDTAVAAATGAAACEDCPSAAVAVAAGAAALGGGGAVGCAPAPAPVPAAPPALTPAIPCVGGAAGGNGDGAPDTRMWGDDECDLGPTRPVSPFAFGRGGAAGPAGDHLPGTGCLPPPPPLTPPSGCCRVPDGSLDALAPFEALMLDDHHEALGRNANNDGTPVLRTANTSGAGGGLALALGGPELGPGGGRATAPSSPSGQSMGSMGTADLADLDEVDLCGSDSLLEWSRWLDAEPAAGAGSRPGSPVGPPPPLARTGSVGTGTAARARRGTPVVTAAAAAAACAHAAAAAAAAAPHVPSEDLQQRMQDLPPQERMLLLTRLVATMIARTVAVPGTDAAAATAGTLGPAVESAAACASATAALGGGSCARATVAAGASQVVGGGMWASAEAGAGAAGPPSRAQDAVPAAALLPVAASCRSSSPAPGSSSPCSRPGESVGGGSSCDSAAGCAGTEVGSAAAAAAAALGLPLEAQQFPPEVILAYLLPLRDLQSMYAARRVVTAH